MLLKEILNILWLCFVQLDKSQSEKFQKNLSDFSGDCSNFFYEIHEESWS